MYPTCVVLAEFGFAAAFQGLPVAATEEREERRVRLVRAQLRNRRGQFAGPVRPHLEFCNNGDDPILRLVNGQTVKGVRRAVRRFVRDGRVPPRS